MPQIVYNPFEYQIPFQNSTKPKVYLSTGWGGGKTFALVMGVFRLMNINRGLPVGFLAPTIKMYKRDCIPTIEEICQENRIRYKYNKTDMQWFFPDTNSTVFVFHSEDGGRSIRGPNLACGAINEVSLCSKAAFLAFMSRIRLKQAKLLQLIMSGTPESFSWTYEYFVEEPRDDTDFILGDARLNTHVSGDYFGTLKDSLDDLMFQQYVEGKHVNLVGKRCAYAFDRKRHTAPDIDKLPQYPVWVHVDFNVSPMSASLYNRVPLGHNYYGGDRSFTHQLRCFDEVCINSSNTYEVVDAIKAKTSRGDDITIYPDPAGRGRHTNVRSNISDIDILRDAFGRDKVKYKTRISVRDCLNALNTLLSKDMIIFNSKKCRQTIADLEQCVFKQDVFEIDKSNPKRTHWLDGLKYMADYEFPIRKQAIFREQRIR